MEHILEFLQTGSLGVKAAWKYTGTYLLSSYLAWYGTPSIYYEGL